MNDELHIHRHVALSAILACAFVIPAIACSSSGEADPLAGSDGGADGSSARDDASDADDGGTTDGADAQPRTCSADGFCHTKLPEKSLLRDVWSAGDGVVWSVGWNDPLITAATGTILRWDGQAWTVSYESEARLNAVWGSGPTDIWVGGDGGLYHGTGPSSAEITWTKVRSEPIASIWGSSANDVWAVGSTKTYQYFFDGKVLHYSGPAGDGGDGWAIDPISQRPAAYRKVWGTSANDVWIGGAEYSTCGMDICTGTRGIVLRRRPDGNGVPTWSDAAMPEFVGILPATGPQGGSELSGGGAIADGSRVFAMGNRSPLTYAPTFDVLFAGTPKSDGSGDYTWTDSTFGTCRGFGFYQCGTLWFSRAVWGRTADDFYVAGDYGQLRHWNGTGFSFVKTTTEKIPVIADFYALWGSPSGDLWVVGDEIALHKRASNHSEAKAYFP